MPIERGSAFDPEKGRRRFEPVYCPWCAMPEQGGEVREMLANPLFAYEPQDPLQERLATPTYDYRCSACRCRLNYPVRLRV